MSVITRLQPVFDGIVRELRHRHAELNIETYSHSVGEATELDGWSMGFTMTGLVEPIFCEIYVVAIHSQPRQIHARAEWRSARNSTGIWDDWEQQRKSGNSPEPTEITKLTGLLEAVLEAIASGPAPRRESFLVGTMHSYSVEHEVPTPEVRESLREEEVGVYQAWFAYLRDQNVHPIRLMPGGPLTGYRPNSPAQQTSLARLLCPSMPEGEALVRSLFTPEQIPTHLQGPGFEVVTESDPLPGPEFYARHPRGHGAMGLSAIGFHGDQAVFFVSNLDGGFPDQGPVAEVVTRLGTGGFLAVLERQEGSWRVQRVSRLPWDWVRRALLEGELFLHFAGRAQLQVLHRDCQEGALHLHLRLEPQVGQFLEFHLMERRFLGNRDRVALDCRAPVLIFPHLYGSAEVIPELEKLIVGF